MSDFVSLEVIQVDNGYILLHMRLDCSITLKKDSCVWKLAYKYQQNNHFQIRTIWPKWNIGFSHSTPVRISKVNRSAFDYSLQIYVYPYNVVMKKNVVGTNRSEIKTIFIPADGPQKSWLESRRILLLPKQRTIRQVFSNVLKI